MREDEHNILKKMQFLTKLPNVIEDEGGKAWSFWKLENSGNMKA